MSTVTIYGYSDDLVEVEGDLVEEFPGDDVVLAFGDGTILGVLYTADGVWRIERRSAGSAAYERFEALPDSENDYSDRVTLTGELRWVIAAEKPTLHRIP